jgi:hypothetical protein
VDQFGIGQDTFLKHVHCVFAEVISIYGQSLRGSTVGIVTRLRVVRSWVRFQIWTKHFSFIPNVQTGPGAHPTSYTTRTGSGYTKLTQHLHQLSTLRTRGNTSTSLKYAQILRKSRSHLRRQKGNMNKFPYEETANIRRYSTKFSCLGFIHPHLNACTEENFIFHSVLQYKKYRLMTSQISHSPKKANIFLLEFQKLYKHVIKYFKYKSH